MMLMIMIIDSDGIEGLGDDDDEVMPMMVVAGVDAEGDDADQRKFTRRRMRRRRNKRTMTIATMTIILLS